MPNSSYLFCLWPQYYSVKFRPKIPLEYCGECNAKGKEGGELNFNKISLLFTRIRTQCTQRELKYQ